jgi:hypothetical protein
MDDDTAMLNPQLSQYLVKQTVPAWDRNGRLYTWILLLYKYFQENVNMQPIAKTY